MMKNPLIPIGIIFLMVFFWFAWMMLKNRKQNIKLKPKPKDNCLVFYPAWLKGLVFENVKNPPGQTWLYKLNGKRYYVATRENRDSEYKAFDPSDVIHQLPDKLFRALDCPPARRLLKHRETTLEKLQVWAMVGMVGILAFVMIYLVGELSKPGV